MILQNDNQVQKVFNFKVLLKYLKRMAKKCSASVRMKIMALQFCDLLKKYKQVINYTSNILKSKLYIIQASKLSYINQNKFF